MTTGPQRERFFRHLLQGAGPLMVWALHFFGAYVLVATGCCSPFAGTQVFGISALRASLWLISASAIVVITVLIARSLRLPHSLRRSTGAGGGALALLGVIWTTLPTVLAVPLCLCQP